MLLGDYPVDGSENILNFIFKMEAKFSGASPLLTSTDALVYGLLVKGYGDQKATGPLRNMLPVDRRAPLPVVMAEWAFNPKDLTNVLATVKAYFTTNGWPNIPLEIELTKTDFYFMSPWNWGADGTNPPPYIVKFNFMYLVEFLDAAGKDQVTAHLEGLWNTLVAAGIKFKPHWGKQNFLTPDFVRTNYQLADFLPYVHSVFTNEYISSRIGTGKHA